MPRVSFNDQQLATTGQSNELRPNGSWVSTSSFANQSTSTSSSSGETLHDYHHQLHHHPPPQHHHPQYQYDSDDSDIECSYSLYINESGLLTHLPPPPLPDDPHLHHRTQGDHHQLTHSSSQTKLLQPPPPPTTIYRNGNISIVNCEYNLKEKYPHLGYLIFFMVIYILLVLLGASLFVLFEAKAELRLRDKILSSQQTFLVQHSCVEDKNLKLFVRSVIAAYEKGTNLALLNDLLDAESELNRPPRSVPIEPLQSNTKLSKVEIISSSSSSSSSSEPLSLNVSNVENVEKLIQSVQNRIQLVANERGEPLSKKHKLLPTKSLNDVEKDESSFDDDETGSDQIQIDNRNVKLQGYSVPYHMANWEFSSALIFVASVVTTIGYGHITPNTSEGKLLAIVFGAIAIPFTLLFLSILISMFRDGPIKSVEIWLIRMFSKYSSQTTLLKIRFLHLTLVTTVLFSSLILLPAFIFDQMEPDWSLLDSFYYCFITITTVGLGDYVPGQSNSVVDTNRTLYQIGIVLYMYIGLCLVMLWIALVLRIPYFNFKTFLVIEEPELAEQKLKDEEERQTLLAQHQHHYDHHNHNGHNHHNHHEHLPRHQSSPTLPNYQSIY